MKVAIIRYGHIGLKAVVDLAKHEALPMHLETHARAGSICMSKEEQAHLENKHNNLNNVSITENLLTSCIEPISEFVHKSKYHK